MKYFRILPLILAASLFIGSCQTTFYQLYETQTSETGKLKNQDGLWVYEDDELRLSYQFWSNGGTMSFNIYNKSDDYIILDKTKSFFIVNGTARDYFRNQSITYTTSTTQSKNAQTSGTTRNYLSYLPKTTTNTTSYGTQNKIERSLQKHEKQEIIIPPNAQKSINYFDISNTLIRNCDILRFPSPKKIQSLNYTKNESPLYFSNRLSFKISGKDKKIEHGFYVSKITNYPEKEFVKSEYEEFCGEKSSTISRIFFRMKPTNFYNKYYKPTAGSRPLKH